MSQDSGKENDSGSAVSIIQSPSNAKCGKCKQSIAKDAECVGCDYCLEWYHRVCVNVTKNLFAELSRAPQRSTTLKWSCLLCTESNNTSSDSNSSSNALANEFSMMREEFRSIFNKIGAFEEKITNKFEVMSNSIHSLINDVKKENCESINAIQQYVMDNKSAIESVEKDVDNLNRQLSNLHRLINLLSLKISGIPPSKEKDYDIGVVTNIASFYNIALEPKSIEFCGRLKNNRNNNQSVKISPIIVRFASKEEYLRLPVS